MPLAFVALPSGSLPCSFRYSICSGERFCAGAAAGAGSVATCQTARTSRKMSADSTAARADREVDFNVGPYATLRRMANEFT